MNQKEIIPKKVLTHLDKYWSLARDFYEQGEYPLASFFAITLIEEVGKLIIIHNIYVFRNQDKKDFYDHKIKYAQAIMMTLKNNSRFSRIYRENEKKYYKGIIADLLRE